MNIHCVGIVKLELKWIIITIMIKIIIFVVQFSGPPINISNPCSAPLCAGEFWVINIIK